MANIMGLQIKKANKTTEFTNASVSKILASTSVAKDIVTRNYANNAAAKAAGLVDGDLYHAAGAVRVVFTA
jgi:hypothetical protein|tara:strand:- start:323 stop:535 length:213 start_codon:yes stop_codon:yes gene_type:complete